MLSGHQEKLSNGAISKPLTVPSREGPTCSATNNNRMFLQLKRPIIFFDLEATGVNISHDRIVELSYIKLSPDGSEEKHTERF